MLPLRGNYNNRILLIIKILKKILNSSTTLVVSLSLKNIDVIHVSVLVFLNNYICNIVILRTTRLIRIQTNPCNAKIYNP